MIEKKKRGFTLIELLAVIVILAVILLIAVPSVLGYIESARKKAFYTSVSNLVDNIKPENVLEEKDYCIYDYSKDEENKTELIDNMFIIAHKDESNNKIVYSVLAENKKNNIIVNTYDFSKLNSDDESWDKKDNYNNTYYYQLAKLWNSHLNGTLESYVPCGNVGR